MATRVAVRSRAHHRVPRHPADRRHRTVLRTPLPEATYVEVANAPHGLGVDHADEVNNALMLFLTK